MRIRSTVFSLESANKEYSIIFFKELFTVDELKEKIKQFSPENIVKRTKNISSGKRKSFYETLEIQQINDSQKLADILYDLVGPHFLYEIQGSGSLSIHSKNFRYEIFRKGIELKWFTLDTINNVVKKLPNRNGDGIKTLEDIVSLRIPGPWQFPMLSLIPSKFNLPSEVVEAPSLSKNKKANIETFTANRELRPLHDYQIFAGKKIRDLITSKNDIKKRLLVSIPTGAGKTRLVAESLIDWLNDGKPSDDLNIANSKYMIWIAQSRELCEQAISQFEEIYSQKGNSALTVFRFFGDRPITLDTILSQRVEHGLIVCTIDKIYQHIKDTKGLSDFNEMFLDATEYDDKVAKSKIPQKFYDDFTFGRLRKMTSCIVVDEAHKAIMPTYTCVLRGFGFNFSKKEELDKNEFGITLVGLTATAFRGTGLERSREVIVGQPSEKHVKLFFSDNGNQKYTEISYPLNCSECKKPISENETILQSTSNPKLVWHIGEEKLSVETGRIYTRFSDPLVPKIYAFQENKKPKAIITCNEKCVAKDPIRISGEKSYDLLGHINKYSWKIEKLSNLIEVFGIKKEEPIIHPIPKNSPVIVEELANSGNYKIHLTVKNYDGLTDTVTKIIEVIPQQKTETSNEMKELIQNLIKREILCEVYHTYIKSGKIDVKREKNKEIDIGGQIRTKAAENNTRNQKLVNSIHYLLTAPKEKRKKILVFACDILHARFLTIWLKTIYGISAEYIDSDLHESRNISRIRKFREPSGNEGKVLINTNMLTTGFDVPDVDCVVMGRPVMSTVEYTQMIGRGMRGPRMTGTKEVWIVDFDDQIQLSEQMKHQAIPLGWKSMAYDENNKFRWKSLTEKLDYHGNPLKLDLEISSIETQKSVKVNKSWSDEKIFATTCQSCERISEGVLEIFKNYDLTYNEKENLGKCIEYGEEPKLPALKLCNMCRKVNEIFPETNNPWRKLIVKEFDKPVLLHIIMYLARDGSNHKIDTNKILNVSYFINKISTNTSNVSLSELELLEKEIDDVESFDIETIQKKIDEAKNILSKNKLADFWTDYIILGKDFTQNSLLIRLCDFFLRKTSMRDLLKIHEKIDDPLSKLKKETHRIIFDVLGYIPDEDKFQEILDPELYNHMITKFTTYHQFQQNIHIPNIMIKIQKRNEYMNVLIDYFNKYSKTPSVEILELLFPNFRTNVREYYGKSKNFFKLMNMIQESSQKDTIPLKYEDLKNDYNYVRELTPFTPSTEEIIRHSKVGIGQYMNYCKTIPNFQKFYEEIDDETRLKFENVKSSFYEIKKSIGAIPNEDTMTKHTQYLQIIDPMDFDSYGDFLRFIGEDAKPIKQNPQNPPKKESKEKIISNAKAFVKSNGMGEFFEHLVREPELKYNILFGDIEEFIKIIFSDNKQIALMRWKDIKSKK